MSRTSNALDYIDVMRIVNTAVTAAGGRTKFAARCGLTRQYMCMILNAQRPPPDVVLKEARVRRVVTEHYEIVENTPDLHAQVAA